MDSLAHIVSKTRGYLVATSNISVKGIRQIAAQERKSETMAAELIAGAAQFRLGSFDAQGSEHPCTGIAGELLQVTSWG
jgi:hypothetical protein